MDAGEKHKTDRYSVLKAIGPIIFDVCSRHWEIKIFLFAQIESWNYHLSVLVYGGIIIF